MGAYIITNSELVAIANAIRNKNSSDETFTLEQIPNAIATIGENIGSGAVVKNANDDKYIVNDVKIINIANAIRNKLNISDKITIANMPNLINNIQTNYTINYYNGNILLKSEEVAAGTDAIYSGTTPTKTQNAQYTYSFAGWSKDDDNTVDSDALTAVAADRNVYACYTETLRTYTVRWYNGSTLLETDTNVPYGSSATYGGTTPVDPSGQGLDFTGFVPNGQNITGDTNCYAQFAAPEPEHTITDTWDEIFQHITLGDYSTRYSIGDTMSLNLGSEGYINMEIVAFDTDVLASDSTKTAPITWISEQLLKTSHRMNPALEYGTKTVDAWTASSDTWTSQNKYVVSTAKATWTITATSAGTLSIFYKTSNSNVGRNKITTLTVNGTAVATNYANTTGTTYTVEVASGDVVTVYCEYDLLSASYNYYGTVTFSSTGTFTTSANVDTVLTRDTANMIEGTGTIGGYAASEMGDYIQNTIKPLIPSDVRSHIVPVTKYTRNYNTAGSAVNNVESTEDVWIPSMREMNFSGAETIGPQYSTAFPDNASRIKYKTGASSASEWWLRSANGGASFASVHNSGARSSNTPASAYALALGFCT